MFWCFGCEEYGILARWPGIKPAPPAQEGEVSTTEQAANSPLSSIPHQLALWYWIIEF